ncbi:MAG: hypothetical protein IRY87_29185 [Acetobacteraceae bacterium]|nr:hypothetical protein [Acetobacteraceae bacterium]
MAVHTTSVRTTLAGNGSATVFPFGFHCADPATISVVYTDPGGARVTLEPSAYSVTLNAPPTDGGWVTYPLSGSPIPAGSTLTISRTVPLTQDVELTNQGGFYPTVLNGALDRLAMVDQQLADAQARSISGAQTDPVGLDMSLPPVAERAGKALWFDSLGRPIAAAGTLPGVPVTSFGASLVAATDSNAALDTVTHTRPEAGAVAVPLKQIIRRQWVRPEDFGALHNGVADDLPAIQAAFASGQNVEFGPYDYRISGAVQVTTRGQRVRGQGALTRILSTSTTADFFTLGDGTNLLNDLKFEDFVLWATVTKTAGYGFNGRMVQNCQWEGVHCGDLEHYQNNSAAHRLWRGWYFDGFFRCEVDRDCAATVASHGIMCRGRSAGTYGAELEIEADLIFCGNATTGGAGVLIGGGCGGVYVNGEVSRCWQGVRVDTTLEATRNREIFLLPRAIIDSCDDYGLLLNGDCAALIDITGAWFTSSGRFNNAANGVGLYATPDCTATIRLTGGRLYNNRVSGAVIAGGQLTMTGVNVTAQGASDTDGIGLWLAHANAIGAVVVGNHFGGNKTGLKLDGNVHTFTIADNVFSGNSVAHITGVPTFPALGPLKQIRNNVGFITENQGVVIIPNGQSGVTVNHGLSVPPNVILISSGGPNAQNVRYRVVNITGTTFDISATATLSGNDEAIHWRASVGV